MTVLTGPFAAACLLLVAAGLPKTVRPDDLRRALRVAGLGVPGLGVRLAGAFEAVVGVAGLLVGGRLVPALVAVSYAAFTGFVTLAVRRGWPLATCGCFGREDTPPTATHALVTGAFTVVATVATAAGTVSLPDVLADQPWSGLPLLAAVGLTAWLGFLALTALPRLAAASRSAATSPPGHTDVATFRLLTPGGAR